jgi:hypothetical protein
MQRRNTFRSAPSQIESLEVTDVAYLIALVDLRSDRQSRGDVGRDLAVANPELTVIDRELVSPEVKEAEGLNRPGGDGENRRSDGSVRSQPACLRLPPERLAPKRSAPTCQDWAGTKFRGKRMVHLSEKGAAAYAG